MTLAERGRESRLVLSGLIETGGDAPETAAWGRDRQSHRCRRARAGRSDSAQRRVAIGEPLVERVFGAKLFGKRRARQRGKGEERSMCSSFSPGNLDLNAANPSAAARRSAQDSTCRSGKSGRAEAGRLLGMRRQRGVFEELVIADDPGPVEAPAAAKTNLAVHDAHHLQAGYGARRRGRGRFRLRGRAAYWRDARAYPTASKVLLPSRASSSLYRMISRAMCSSVHSARDALTRPRVMQPAARTSMYCGIWKVVDLEGTGYRPR